MRVGRTLRRGDGGALGLAFPVAAMSTSPPTAVAMAMVAAAAAAASGAPASSPSSSPSSPVVSSSSPPALPISPAGFSASPARSVAPSSSAPSASARAACTSSWCLSSGSCSCVGSVSPLSSCLSSLLPPPVSLSTPTSTCASSGSSPSAGLECASRFSASVSLAASWEASRCANGRSARWTNPAEARSRRSTEKREEAACSRNARDAVGNGSLQRAHAAEVMQTEPGVEGGSPERTREERQAEDKRSNLKTTRTELWASKSGEETRGRVWWSLSALKRSADLLRRIESAIEEGKRRGREPQRFPHFEVDEKATQPDASDKETAPHQDAETRRDGNSAVHGEKEDVLKQQQEEMTPAVTAELLEKGLQVLVDAFRLFGPESVILSFNGGKDAVVALHLYRAALAKFLLGEDCLERTGEGSPPEFSSLLARGEAQERAEEGAQEASLSGETGANAPERRRDRARAANPEERCKTACPPRSRAAQENGAGREEEAIENEGRRPQRVVTLTGLPRPKAIYFHGEEEEFEEVAAFVEQTAKEFELDVSVYHCGLAEGVQDFVTRFSHLRPLAFVLGSREGDPNAAHLLPLQVSSSWLPAFLRVHPLVGFRYGHVWYVIRRFALPYCPLYDRGYTSIGRKNNTKPNPRLLRPETGLHAPAYLLENWADERSGRD
ncbi:putative DJ-1/PfpI family domian-containing protein [Neospora caninum Liverpool]|uniref:FAD synthase n=1 Tax=Neospora caninum (strain Liverpool) TaxID=572307 RepID=F0VKX4_NEOCL|nr:putative DJ-1/PfpI family domian-containing protein [Neospora caninum Liverpool]CBZ54725.1 putative DJ-1/PfpI family domian-containing protein [Neospora caninum Liverpool]CEL69441.1 TPA: DJ-1/PfpI family domian-containing protein,putative [Neospora caninum Liverpool]|eukprot:XP_003884755.1 putative DJ-1/PfpI family domian-containing protein [Neospora caninum Liverpool]